MRVALARSEADVELREDKVEEQLRDVEEREARLAQREADLNRYVTAVQGRISAA